MIKSKKFLLGVFIMGIVINGSSCSLFKKEFTRQPISNYLNPQIQAITSVTKTVEIEKMFEGVLNRLENVKLKGSTSLRDLLKNQNETILKKLGLESYLGKQISADLSKRFYFVTAKDGGFNLKKFNELGKKLNQDPNNPQSLNEISTLINLVLVYELSNDVNFSSFYKDLIKSVKKQTDLKINEKEFLDYTIYTINGSLMNYFVSEEILTDPKVKEVLINLLPQISVMFSGDYVFVSTNSAAIEGVLKNKDEDNAQLKERLTSLEANQSLLYTYTNTFLVLDGFKNSLKEVVKALPGGFGLTTQVEGLFQSDLLKLPQYALSEGDFKDRSFRKKEVLYKNPEIIKKYPQLSKIPKAYESILATSEVSNVLFSLELNDLNGQFEYLKSLALLTGMLDETTIQKGLDFVLKQVPLLSVLKSDLKSGDDFSLKLFLNYNPARITDQPLINILFNSNDSAKMFKNIENAVSIYNKIRERDNDDKLPTLPYSAPEMVYKLLSDDFAVISFKVNNSMETYLEGESKEVKLDSGAERAAAYIGNIKERNLIYIGLTGSKNLASDQPLESFQQIFELIKKSTTNDTSLGTFTNSINFNFKAFFDLILTLQKTTKDDLLAQIQSQFKNNLKLKELGEVETILDIYTSLLDGIFKINTINFIHKTITPESSEFSFELKWE